MLSKLLLMYDKKVKASDQKEVGMKKMNEYKINSLKKVPKKAISWMGIDTDKTHFVDLVDRSNELGLDYLAERLTPTSSVKELEFDHSIEKKSEVPLADAYVGVGICGRDLKFYAQHLDKRYLSQGHVFLYLHINYDDDEKINKLKNITIKSISYIYFGYMRNITKTILFILILYMLKLIYDLSFY